MIRSDDASLATGRHLVVITGFTRSGSSTVAAAVRALGVSFGDHLRDGDRLRNPAGYLEDEQVVALGRQLRRSLVASQGVGLVDDQCWHLPAIRELEEEAVMLLEDRLDREEYVGKRPLWAFKNNGVLRFLPFWERVFTRMGVSVSWILPVRHPLAAVQSRRKFRANQPFKKEERELSLDLYEWLVSVVPHLSKLRNQSALAVSYDGLVANPGQEVARIGRFLARTAALDAQAAPDFAHNFLDASLRHFQAAEHSTLPVPLAQQAWDCLDGLSRDVWAFEAPAFWEAWLPLERQLRDMAPLLAQVDRLQESRRKAELNPLSPLLRIYRGLRRSVAVRTVEKPS